MPGSSGKRMLATSATVVAVVVWACAVLLADRLEAQRVGLFFDENAESCTAEIVSFETVDAWVFAFPEPDMEFGGVIFSLKFPVDIEIAGDLIFPKYTSATGDMTSENGLDLKFQRCPIPTSAPIELVRFTLADLSFGGDRLDLQIEVAGAVLLADSTVLRHPQLGICDPEDPEGSLGLVRATGMKATLNCTGECPCVTAIERRTWGAIKRLYTEN